MNKWTFFAMVSAVIALYFSLQGIHEGLVPALLIAIYCSLCELTDILKGKR